MQVGKEQQNSSRYKDYIYRDMLKRYLWQNFTFFVKLKNYEITWYCQYSFMLTPCE